MTSLFTKIKHTYEHAPEKTALVIGQESYSFTQLQKKVEAACFHFSKLGITQKDKVALVLPNGIEFIVSMLALAELNACLVPLPLGINTKAFATACNNTNIQHVIAWHASIKGYRDITSAQGLEIRNWIAAGKDLEFAYSFNSLVDDPKGNFTLTGELDLHAPYILTMTSGSTGTPKPIALSQHTKIERANSAIDLYQMSDNDTTLIATPLYHSLAERLIFVSLLSGGTAVLMPKFTIANWLQQIADNRVTFSIAVSSQLKQILSYQPIPDLSSLRCIVSSSALLDIAIKQKLLEILNCEFHECYGASEIAIATNIKFDREHPIPSVGKAITGTSLLLLDDNRQVVKVGEVGEIACKTPMVFSGYYKQRENTLSAFHQDYFCTGDLGKLDTEGNLYFVGRKKEIIITGGINIYPSDIESVVKEHHLIDSAVAFALDDEGLGEVVALALTLSVKDDEEESVVQQLRIKCATELDAQQQPRKYFIFKQLPQNAMGKINKLEIKSIAESQSNSSQWLYKMEQN